jgi:hypothetical protein
MQDLRLIGVHEDGVHLILADEDGNRSRLPLDEALRSAARREHARPGQLPLDLEATLRPKDVQAMIRAGLSTEEVAERAGWTVEKVHRYEVPILAEREHIAGLARQVRLRARSGTHGSMPTLGERVADRLRSREIDASAAWWDSRRADRGSWTVLLTFTAGGRQRQAAWDFDPLARTVVARDDEARWLSEDEAMEMPGPIPAPHLAPGHRPTRLYDVEAEGGIGGPERPRGDETVDLMAAMRERSAQRGRRRRTKAAEVPGLDRAPVEALPLAELAGDPSQLGPPPAAHPHPADDPDARLTADDDGEGVQDAEDTIAPDESDALREPAAHDDHATSRPTTPAAHLSPHEEQTDQPGRSSDDGTRRPARVAATHDRSTAASAAMAGAARRTGTDHGSAAARPTGGTAPAPAGPKPKPPPTRKSGRPSVPSWDDIMFGRKPD